MFKKKKIELLEEKAEFTESIKQIWMHGNYEKIKEAHNEILTHLKEKDFDFFSVWYLLTMMGTELLVNEYIEAHKEEITAKLKKMAGGE